MGTKDDFAVERCTARDLHDWALLRRRLWPYVAGEESLADVGALLAREAIGLLARASDGNIVGFAEATLRRDFVNGCSTSPVVFLEGIYVDPAWRRRGVARKLCQAVERWGMAMGCSEFASDTEVSNVDSQRVHAKLGFEETDRVVYFRKAIEPRGAGID